MAVLDLAAAGDFVAEFGVFGELVSAAQASLHDVLAEHGDELVHIARTDPVLRDVLATDAYREILPAGFLDRLDEPLDGPDQRGETPMRAQLRRNLREVGAGPATARLRAHRMPGASDMPEPRVERIGGIWIVTLAGAGWNAKPAFGEIWWVRVLDRDHSVLAASPLRVDGRNLVAELVLPPHIEPAEAVVQVTDEPFPPTRPHSLDHTMRAVRAGRRAVEFENAGDHRRAQQHWEDCCRRWDELDDEPRTLAAMYNAEFAGRRAQQRAVALGSRSFVTDHVSVTSQFL
jgi:hypothetical protein